MNAHNVWIRYTLVVYMVNTRDSQNQMNPPLLTYLLTYLLTLPSLKMYAEATMKTKIYLIFRISNCRKWKLGRRLWRAAKKRHLFWCWLILTQWEMYNLFIFIFISPTSDPQSIQKGLDPPPTPIKVHYPQSIQKGLDPPPTPIKVHYPQSIQKGLGPPPTPIKMHYTPQLPSIVFLDAWRISAMFMLCWTALYQHYFLLLLPRPSSSSALTELI